MRKRLLPVLLSLALLLPLVTTAFAGPIPMTLVQESPGEPNKEFVYYTTNANIDTKQAHVEQITATWNKCNCGFVVFSFQPHANEIWETHAIDCGSRWLWFNQRSAFKITLKHGERITFWPNQVDPHIYAEQEAGYSLSYSTDGQNFTDYVHEERAVSVATIKFPVVQNGTLTMKRASTTQTLTAKPTNDTLRVDGKLIQNATIYKINGSNYFKLRDVAAVLTGTKKQFSVIYDKEVQSITVTTGKPYSPNSLDLTGAAPDNRIAMPSNDTFLINGAVAQGVTVYKIAGNNYFKLRDLGNALGFEVDWEAGQGMFINTN